jgi:hypothetical protein
VPIQLAVEDGSGLPKNARDAVAVAESGFHWEIVPSQSGIVEVATKALDRKPTGQTSTCTIVTLCAFFTVRPMKIPTHSNANRSNSSSPNAASAAGTPSCHRQPSASPAPARMISVTAESSMSAMHRPDTTAAELIGSDRNRSVTPLSLSWVTAVIVPSSPNSIARVKMPGTRSS